MNDLWECFLAGCATGAGVALALCIPALWRWRSRVQYLEGWSGFWSRREDQSRRVRG
jgi:hypothetical protein